MRRAYKALNNPDDNGAGYDANRADGRWRDVLSPEDNRRDEAMARERLGEQCAAWLTTGAMAAQGRADPAAGAAAPLPRL